MKVAVDVFPIGKGDFHCHVSLPEGSNLGATYHFVVTMLLSRQVNSEIVLCCFYPTFHMIIDLWQLFFECNSRVTWILCAVIFLIFYHRKS